MIEIEARMTGIETGIGIGIEIEEDAVGVTAEIEAEIETETEIRMTGTGIETETKEGVEGAIGAGTGTGTETIQRETGSDTSVLAIALSIHYFSTSSPIHFNAPCLRVLHSTVPSIPFPTLPFFSFNPLCHFSSTSLSFCFTPLLSLFRQVIVVFPSSLSSSPPTSSTYISSLHHFSLMTILRNDWCPD
jgi:hypothetical protein